MRSRALPIAALSVAVLALTVAIISLSVGEKGVRVIQITGTPAVQQLIGGIRQLEERLGNDDAPVTINLFIDIQCPSCADYRADVVDELIANEVRRGEAKILLRHRPVGLKPTTVSAFGAVAAANQDRGWQYAELVMRNLDQVPDGGVDEEFLNEVAAVTPKLEVAQWQEDVRSEETQRRAQADDELAVELGVPAGTAMIIEGASGSELLVRSPSLEKVRATIAAVG